MKNPLLYLLFILTFPPVLSAQYLGGNGGGDICAAYTGHYFSNWFITNGNWNTASNWSENSVPGDTDDAFVKAHSTMSGHYTYPNLTIGSSGQLAISFTESSLTVTGDLINNGSLLIESNTGGTGSLIHTTSGVSATIQRYINGWSTLPIGQQATHGWHFISSPVANQTFVEFPIYTSENDLYKWDETLGLWINRTASGGGINPAFETTFVTGQGYLIAQSINQVRGFTGSVNVSDMLVSGLTNTSGKTYSGWHLLGNPFSSALEWNQSGGSWNLSGTMAANCQIWNEATASYSIIEPNGIIPVTNGFMVYTSDNGGSLTIPATARIRNSANWYKVSDSENDRIVLTAFDTEGSTRQQSTIRFHPDATDTFDLPYDSYFIAGYAPMLYSVSNHENYALNTLSPLTEGRQVPLHFIKNNNHAFILELTQNLPGVIVLLNDLKSGNSQNMSINPAYHFTSSTSDDPSRFLITFGNLGIEEEQTTSPFTIFSYENAIRIMDNTSKSQGQVFIYDVTGKLIHSQELSGSAQTRLSLTVSAGIYIVRVISDNHITSAKIFLQ